MSEVKAVTQVEREGVRYRVVREDTKIWEKFVYFGRQKRNRPGGAAFREAAREQEDRAAFERDQLPLPFPEGES